MRRVLRGLALRLSTIALAVLVTLVVVEVTFRLLGYRPLHDVYSDTEFFFQYDPRLGWSQQPGAQGQFVGPLPFPIRFRTPVRLNSLGLRGPEVKPLQPGGLRLLILGDSWTAGFEVPEKATYSSVLQGELRKQLGIPVEVINGGVRGYGTDQALLLYRERLAALDPDLVVYHVTGNDPDDNLMLHRIRRVFAKPAFSLKADGTLGIVGRPVPGYPQCSEYRVVDGTPTRLDGWRARVFCWFQTTLADHSAFFSFVTHRLQSNPALLEALYGLGGPTEEGQEDIPAQAPGAGGAEPAPGGAEETPPNETEAEASSPAQLDYAHRLTSVLVETLAREVQASGGEFALAGTSWDIGGLDAGAFDREGIPLLQIDAALEEEGEVLIPHDGHPNELGHRRIAEVLAEQLVSLLEPLVEP